MSNKAWEYRHSIEGKASRRALWRLYSDVTTWSSWDKGLDWARVDGEFKEGTSGTIKPEGQDQLPFRLTKVAVESRFDDETEVPGAGVTIRFTHVLESVGEGKSRITHSVYIEGPEAASVGPKIGPEIASGIPEAMESLMRMAEQMKR